MPLSVVIITLNAQRTLEKTLQSLPQGVQIVVVDSGSTDKTQEICQRYGAQFHYRKWEGFGPQRNAATALCKMPLILYLDADEWLTPGLKTEIMDAVENSDMQTAYRVRRRSCIQGRFVKFGDWSNDYITRLVPRKNAVWTGEEPHPRLEEKNLRILTFKNPLLHDPYSNLQEYEKKIRCYARQWALEEHRRGKTTNHLTALTRATWRWFRGYVLRAGFLDGKTGLLIAGMSAKMVLYKHEELKRLSKHTHT